MPINNENPILKFSQGRSFGSSTLGSDSGNNPLLDFISEQERIRQGAKSEQMKGLLGADANNLPQTVDDARKLQEKNPSLWSRISKQLMKPIGLVATLAEETGKAIGSAASGDMEGVGEIIKNTPAKLGGIITGTRTRSFTDIWQENAKESGINPTVATIAGLVVDIAADWLNFIGGGLTQVGKVTSKVEALRKTGQTIKAGSKLSKQLQALGLADDVAKLSLGATKAEQVQIGQRAMLTLFANTRWEKTLVGGARLYEYTGALKTGIKQTAAAQAVARVFSTKTSNEAFNITKNHFTNLMDYRRGQVMDEAMDIQNSIGKFSKDEAYKILDVIETGKQSGIAAIDDVASRLIKNFDNIKTVEEKLGLLKTDIQLYFPHIKVAKTGEQLTSWQKFKSLFTKADGTIDDSSKAFTNAKTFSTKLGSSKSRKIEGIVTEINKQFGTEFFETRPAVAYAQRALASAKATTSKEFFDAVKQFGVVADDVATDVAAQTVKGTENWIPVAVKELKGMKFAPDVARQIDNYYKAIKPDELNVAVRAYDSVQNWWKAQALVAPSYHIRNMAGNFWNNFLAGITDPKAYFDAGRIQTGKMVQFTDDAGRVWDTPTIIKAAKQSGVLNEGWYAKDIATSLASEMGGISWNPLKQNFALFRANRSVGSVFENNARLAHFVDLLKKGETIDNAAMSVKKFLFDYGDLTWTEKNLFKRVIPFYTWTRKNIPIQLEKLATQPAKFALMAKGINAIESSVPEPNEKYLGDYIKENIGVRVGQDERGNTYYFLLGNWLPSAQAIDILSQPVENFIQMVSPFLKTPVELWANQSTFFEDTFGQPSKIERYPEENQSWLGLTMRKKTAYVLKNIRILNELDKLNPGAIFGDKDTPSVVNRIAPNAGVRLPYVGTITTSEERGGRFTPETAQTSRVLQSMFGKAIPYNPSYAKQFYLWDTDTKVRELERAIKDAQRDGQDEYAKRLRQELNKIRKSR